MSPLYSNFKQMQMIITGKADKNGLKYNNSNKIINY